MLFPADLPDPGIEPGSPELQVDFLLAELQGKPKNTGVGSLSLLQGIFLIQESNWGLLHCRQIPYQLTELSEKPLKTVKCTEVKVAQLCPTLCDPRDYTVHGILQARIMEWVAFLFSRGSS